MTTSFSSLPVVDLGVLQHSCPSSADLERLSQELDHVFSTTGFAYLVNLPLSFRHEEVFGLAREFFSLSFDQKMKLAKKTFVPGNENTYRGYFPPQPGQLDNLKEGFEMGPPNAITRPTSHLKAYPLRFNLTESNIWPESPLSTSSNAFRTRIESFYIEMQSLSARLLSLLAVALGQTPDFFANYLQDSLSTLRLLHYPPQPSQGYYCKEEGVRLCCTSHTDSGILTLLHQDPTTPGLEVQNAAGDWIPAPYIPGSIVVNIGDLMGMVSGGRWVATLHRVRANAGAVDESGMGRLSVPFFFEPGEECIVRSASSGEGGGVKYGDHVREKMGSWIEFQETTDLDTSRAMEQAAWVGVQA